MSKGGQIEPGGGGPRGDFGDPAYDAGNNGLMLGGLPPSLYNGLNQMPTTYDYFGPPTPMMPQYDFGPAMPYGSPYAPTPMMSQPGAINDPTVNAALAVLNRSQPSNQMPGLMPMMMPAMRGSGVSDQVRQYNFGLVPETPYQTATYSTPAAPVDSGAGSDSGGMDVGVDNGFSSLSPSDRAAYYAENPTMGSIGRVVNSVVENSLPGQIAGYFDPGVFTRSDAILAGMDPTGWQFAERESDGLMGTQIGGTLTFPELTPENFGPYAFPETNAPVVGDYVADAPVASPVSSPVGIDAFGGAGPDVGSVGIDAFGGAGPDVGSVGIDAFGGAGPSVDTGSGGIDAFGGYGSDVGSVGIDAFGGSGPSVDTGSGSIDAFGGAGPSVDTGSVGIDAFGGSGPDVGGGGDGGGGGGKIICTAMNQAYGFGSFRNSIWLTYSAQHMTKAHEAGYHALFLPLVDYGFKRGDGKINMAVRKTLEWIARHRTKDLRAEMRGTKRDTTGRIIRFIFEPLCYAAGKLKGY